METSPARGDSPPDRATPTEPFDRLRARGERALVWVVDDNTLEVEMVRRALSDRYEVEAFPDGATMLERRAGGRAPDTLVLDCQLPGMSGIEVCRFLRGTADEIALPVLMLTVHGHKQDVIEGLAAGANDYVTKPYDAAELVARVGTLVRTKRLHERARRAEHEGAIDRAHLRRSEQRLLMVAEAIPQIVWTATPDGALEYVNQRWFELTAMSLKEAQGRGWYALVHPDDREACVARWARSVATGEVFDLQIRLRRAADGEHRWYLGRALPLRDAEGRVTEWFGTFTDIDEQKRTEAQIDAIFEGAPVGIGLLDRGLCYLRVNEALAATHHLAKEAHVGRAFREVVPDVAAEIEPLLRRVLETGEPLTDSEVTRRVPAGSGRELHLLANYFPVHVGGQNAGLAVMATDITERKRAERALDLLARAGAELVAALDATARSEIVTRISVPSLADAAGVYLCDREETFELAAGSHDEATAAGVLRDLAIGIRALLRAGGGARGDASAACLVPDVAEARRGVTGEGPAERDVAALERLCAAGVRSCILAPLAVQGRLFGYLALATAGSGRRYDAADVALAEELGRRAAVAIDNARLFEMMQQERARVEEANHAKDEFLAVVSHELRAPLTAILGWANLLTEGGLSAAEHERAVQTIERNARSQAQLVADLLDVGSIVSGKLRLNLGPVAPAAIVEAAIDTIRLTAEGKGVRLRIAIDDDTGAIRGDPERLQQIVGNLLTNAVKFTPEGGLVEVVVRRAGGHVEIAVSDTGRGIAPEFLPHVFKRFRQAEGGITRHHGGLGLGLTITRHLVELHGGTVEASSPGDGLGATFVVRLPVRAVPAGKTTGAESVTPATLPCPPELEGLRVLVVDDEADVCAFMRAVLTTCKARVVTATSAAEAIEEIRKELPDVLVSDVGMPGESGYDLLRKLRRLPPEQGGRIPAIALTGYARMEDRTRALMMGFDMHIPKPIEPSELVIAIARLAARLRGS
jgi:PAS domain S-box-containing protein